MSSFKNDKKAKFLESIPVCSIEEPKDTLATRCKFNFSYFERQTAGQGFSDWDHQELVKLFEKLREYCRSPLDYWENQRAGKSGRILAVYGGFPNRSDFTLPKHVPHEARWARFRLEHSTRLVGFILPSNYNAKRHASSGHVFCCNTFYVVFLDRDHQFYKGGEAH